MMLQTIRAATLALAVAALAGADPRPAQPFDLPGYDGRRVTLEDLKGGPSVLMFFSTDCPHCQQTSERLAPVYKALQRPDVDAEIPPKTDQVRMIRKDLEQSRHQP